MQMPTPPMGWNSWNTFGGEIHEELIQEMVRALRETGLAEVGYDHMLLDDLWQAPDRDGHGALQADAQKFPRGMASLAQESHDAGLRFGIYSCAGTHTCAERPASYGNESLDAKTFAAWGVDFLKYDFCNVPFGTDGVMLYRRMGQALRETGRPITFSACEWGLQEPWKWGRSAGCHLWRTTGDIVDNWGSVVDIGFRRQAGLESYAGPNGWNDPDMLVVGLYNQGNAAAGGCTDNEYKVHFGHWCMLAAPLIIGADLRNLSAEAHRILAHRGLIEINQDPLGAQARQIMPFETHWDWADLPVYVKPMADGSLAFALYNLRDDKTMRRQVAWETLGLSDRKPYQVTDVWTGEDLGDFQGSFSAQVPPHDAFFGRVRPRVK